MESQLVKGESGIRSQNYLAPKPHQENKRCVSSSTVKPDPPKNLKLKPLKDSRHVEVSWEYPDTWSTPHSYFSLTFSLQVQGKNKRERVRCDSVPDLLWSGLCRLTTGWGWMMMTTTNIYLALFLCLFVYMFILIITVTLQRWAVLLSPLH